MGSKNKLKRFNENETFDNVIQPTRDEVINGFIHKGKWASFFGNNKNYDYILKTTFVEKKENRVVKQNQVAEKIDYTFEVEYELFYKTKNCLVFKKEIISRFSFTPKSFGYNFGADRSFEKLYTNTTRQNIQKFIDLAPLNTICL